MRKLKSYVKALDNFKLGEIRGAINVACTLEKKNKLIKDEVDEVKKELNQKCPDHLLNKFKLAKSTIKRNTARVKKGEKAIRELQQQLTTAKIELLDRVNKSALPALISKVDETEKSLESSLAELKKAQDSWKKPVSARQKLIITLDANRSGTTDNEESSNSEELSDSFEHGE